MPIGSAPITSSPCCGLPLRCILLRRWRQGLAHRLRPEFGADGLLGHAVLPRTSRAFLGDHNRGSLVLLPGAYGAIEASRDVQPLSLRARLRYCLTGNRRSERPIRLCSGSYRAAQRQSRGSHLRSPTPHFVSPRKGNAVQIWVINRRYYTRIGCIL